MDEISFVLLDSWVRAAVTSSLQRGPASLFAPLQADGKAARDRQIFSLNMSLEPNCAVSFGAVASTRNADLASLLP